MSTHRELALSVYEDSGREVTQNFTTMYSNISLASGLLAAILAALGAGELFKSGQSGAPVHGLPDLSPVSLMILCLAFPLLVRALVRSMLGYNNLLRYNRIRAAAWQYLCGQKDWVHFFATHEIYQTKWRAPEAIGKSMRSNMKYGFFWLFVVFAIATGWAFYSTTGGWKTRIAAATILVAGSAWEAWNLAESAAGYFKLPTDDDWQSARAAALLIGQADQDLALEDAQVPQRASGMFVGRLNWARGRRR